MRTFSGIDNLLVLWKKKFPIRLLQYLVKIQTTYRILIRKCILHKSVKYTVMHVLQGSCKLAEQCGLFFMYRSFQYVTFMSCNVVVLRRILLYCKVG